MQDLRAGLTAALTAVMNSWNKDWSANNSSQYAKYANDPAFKNCVESVLRSGRTPDGGRVGVFGSNYTNTMGGAWTDPPGYKRQRGKPVNIFIGNKNAWKLDPEKGYMVNSTNGYVGMGEVWVHEAFHVCDNNGWTQDEGHTDTVHQWFNPR